MSGCPRFKQNAWKKELCSNCYRPKEEHKSKKTQREPPILIFKPAAQGILSLGSKKSSKKKKKCVRFTKEESEVIGFGGLEASDSEDDDDFEFEKSEQPTPMEREGVGEEEKALERLTKSNTDFNSSLKNLCCIAEPLKAPTNTQLGKQQKQTLQVTIQPFSSTSIADSRKSHLNKLLEEEDPKPAILNGSPKETPKKLKAMDPKDEGHKDRQSKETSKTKLEAKEEPQNMPSIKTIVIEPKKEERGTPEGRKTHIQRGSIVTKAHEQAKNKLCVQNVQKSDKSSSEDNEDYEEVKTIIITGLTVEEKNEKNLKESIKEQVEVEPTKVKIEQEEVTVKVLKLLNGQNGPPESREMAGEPDGKADSDEHEQETPISPPPRSSFLHRDMNAPEKPPKPAIYSSTTDLKSKPIYQTPPDIKPPPRPTSLLNLTTSDKKEPISNGSTTPEVKMSIVNGSPSNIRTILNGASPESLKQCVLNSSSPELNNLAASEGSLDLKKSSILNTSSPDLKKSMLNGSVSDLKKSLVNGTSDGDGNNKPTAQNGVLPEPKKTSFFHGTPKKPPKTSPLNGLTDVIVSHQAPTAPTARSPSSPDGKSVKSLVITSEVKTSRATSMFNSLSSEFRSFKSFLSSPSEGKQGKGSAPSLPPTPLTLARSVSPPPALPTTPPPTAPSPSASAPSPSISSTSSSTVSSSKRPPSPTSPSSSLGCSSIPPLPTTPPPQPSGLPPPLILNGTTAPPPALAPLQINTQLHLPLTPSDDVPVLQEVCARKRPAPKPPVSDIPPEPLPRRRNSSEANSSGTGTEKKKTRMRQTLRKLWRFGSREEEPMKLEDEPPAIPRPRPQIIHPLDLNKSAVQVLPPHSMEKSSPDFSGASACHSSSRPSKPPPPPRSESLNLMERLRPRESPSSNTGDNVYANLGEGRCGITPVKPQRTGSMRDAQAQKSAAPIEAPKAPVHQNDEPPKSCLPQNNDSSKVFSYQNDTDHVYECVGVSSTQAKPSKSKPLPQPPSSSGSPTSSSEEEIYYPYVTFQNGECKTVMKKRGVVTKSLEENYGAVVIANLEALTHLLKQLSERKSEIPSVIQAATTLSWSSFELAEDVKPLFINSFCFVDGKLEGLEVTLVVSGGTSGLPDHLESWGRFRDVVAEPFVSSNDSQPKDIAIMKRCRVEKFVSFAKSLEKTVSSVREGVHLLLQIVKFMSVDENKSVDSGSFAVLSYESAVRKHKALYLPPEGNKDDTKCHDAALFLSQELLGELALGKVLSRCQLQEMPKVLEAWLWGPATSLPLQAIKRWLDLERANLLQSLVRATPSEDLDLHHLSFLVHTSAPRIAEANEIIHS